MGLERGYIRLSGKYNCPYADKTGKVFEHRYIWWIKYGNENIITKADVIHHINGIKNDNRIENLQKVKLTEHAKLHRKLTEEDKKRYKKDWGIKNKDKINERKRTRRKNNLKEIRSKESSYRKKNRHHMSLIQKRYRDKNKEKINLKKRLKRKQLKEKMKRESQSQKDIN